MDPSTSLFLGIDGGGTKTIALLGIRDGDRIRVIGEGQGGATNPRAVGFVTAFEHLHQTIDAAFQNANLPMRPCRAVLCIAGVGRADEIERVNEWARNSNRIASATVVSEAESVLAATTCQPTPHKSSNAIALICGTGSLAWGRTVEQFTSSRSGGWGYLLGDEGSGYWLGQRLLQYACRIADHREHENFVLSSVLNQLQLHQASDLVSWCYGQADSRHRIAALAPLVFELASNSTPLSNVVEEGALQLAQMVGAVARQLHTQSFQLAFAGSVACHQSEYRSLVCDHLRHANLNVEQSVCVDRPALGALHIAAGAGQR